MHIVVGMIKGVHRLRGLDFQFVTGNGLSPSLHGFAIYSLAYREGRGN